MKKGYEYLIQTSHSIVKCKCLEVTEKHYKVEWETGVTVWLPKTNFADDALSIKKMEIVECIPIACNLADVEPNVRGGDNFWSDVIQFSKSLVVDDIEEKFISYVKEHNFNNNEVVLFRKLLSDAIELNFIVGHLKSSIKK